MDINAIVTITKLYILNQIPSIIVYQTNSTQQQKYASCNSPSSTVTTTKMGSSFRLKDPNLFFPFPINIFLNSLKRHSIDCLIPKSCPGRLQAQSHRRFDYCMINGFNTIDFFIPTVLAKALWSVTLADKLSLLVSREAYRRHHDGTQPQAIVFLLSQSRT